MSTHPRPRLRVTVEPAGWRFDTDGAVALVSAAFAAGIRLPSSCRNGTCRACLCRASSGTVRYPTTEWPGVSAEERAAGWILPCIAQPETDLVIEVPAAMSAGQTG